jgi:hypothetical protein
MTMLPNGLPLLIFAAPHTFSFDISIGRCYADLFLHLGGPVLALKGAMFCKVAESIPTLQVMQ